MAGAGRSVNYCYLCPNNSRDNPNLSFFRFPKDEHRCSLWKCLSNSHELKKYTAEECYKLFRVCSEHFEPDMFTNIGRNRLRQTAYPTLGDELGERGILDNFLEIKLSEPDPLCVEETPEKIISESRGKLI